MSANDSSRELVIPPEAFADDEAAEVLRAWIAKGDLHCSLKPTIWPDPGNWGILLADVASHVARAFQHHSGISPIDSLARMRQAFDVDLDAPTAAPECGFQERQ